MYRVSSSAAFSVYPLQTKTTITTFTAYQFKMQMIGSITRQKTELFREVMPVYTFGTFP